MGSILPYYYPRGIRPYQNRSLVKRSRNYHRSLMIIDTGDRVWTISHGDLRAQWPALSEYLRRTGNRVLRPLEEFDHTFNTFDEIRDAMISWNTIMGMVAKRSRSFPSQYYSGIINTADYEHTLEDLYSLANLAVFQGNGLLLEDVITRTLEVLDRMAEILGMTGGIGNRRGIFKDVLSVALYFAPIFSQVAPVAMFLLIHMVEKMTGRDEAALKTLMTAVGPIAMELVYEIAKDEFLQEHSITAYHIIISWRGLYLDAGIILFLIVNGYI